MPVRPLRILSIGAHPADIFDQSGGAMAHHAARGDYVACVVLTHGARVHDKVISDSMFHREQVPTGEELLNMMAERSDVKAEEVRKACSILGFEDVYFFGEDDAVLLMRDSTVRRLAAMLRQLKPDIVLTHFPREGDPFSNPHAIAGQITMYAIGYAASVDPARRQSAAPGCPGLLFRHRSRRNPPAVVGRGWRLLQRCLHRHH